MTPLSVHTCRQLLEKEKSFTAILDKHKGDSTEITSLRAYAPFSFLCFRQFFTSRDLANALKERDDVIDSSRKIRLEYKQLNSTIAQLQKGLNICTY